MSERPRSGPPHYHGGHLHKHAKQLPKIKLDSAMRDFQQMFPGLTPMVIEAVLRANGGAVDPTVEKLISMCCDQQQKEEENWLPGYYEACCKQQPPPSYNATQSYVDASTQTEQSSDSVKDSSDEQSVLVTERTVSDNDEHLCVAPLCSGSSSTSSVNDSINSSSSSIVKDDDEKVALYLQNKELLQQLRQKQRVIEYLERTSKCCVINYVLRSWFTCSLTPGCKEPNNGIKPNRYSDRKLILVCVVVV